MWRRTTPGLAAALALAFASPPAPAGAARSDCSAPGSRTVLATSTVRVYYTAGQRPMGCLKRSGRRVSLDQGVDPLYAPGDARLGRLRLAGDILGYTWIDPGLPAVFVHSVSLRDGRTLRRARVEPVTILEPSAVAVTALVVRDTGGLGWIQRLEGDVSVWRLDRRGQRRLDLGPGIGIRSLRLVARRLVWRDGGRRRSASLG